MPKQWQGKVGDAWRIVYQPDNPNNRTIHIRAIIDGRMLVYMTHSPSRGWRYSIEPLGYFQMLWRDGNLKRSRSKASLAG